MKPSPSVHLVGSLSLASPQEVFEEVGRRLSACVTRIPDGETGERGKPFTFQKDFVDRFERAEGLERLPDRRSGDMTLLQFGLRSGVNPADVNIENLPFANAALEAYASFKRLRAAGTVPEGARLQVVLPSPVMLSGAFIAPASFHALLPVVERALLSNVKHVLSSIPHQDLALQWDLSVEFAIFEQVTPALAAVISREEIVAVIARITDKIPEPVEVGWHLCYGDIRKFDPERETHHFIEPKDMGILVSVANEICALTQRSVNWVHMPVPRDRTDESYFAPLRELKLKPETVLYLGLVHQRDGVEGALRRISTAKRFYRSFGVATECGMGRRPRETIPALLDLHREIAATL